MHKPLVFGLGFFLGGFVAFVGGVLILIACHENNIRLSRFALYCFVSVVPVIAAVTGLVLARRVKNRHGDEVAVADYDDGLRGDGR